MEGSDRRELVREEDVWDAGDRNARGVCNTATLRYEGICPNLYTRNMQ